MRGRGFATIQRSNQRRKLNVTADVDSTVSSANAVNAALRDEILPELKERYPRLDYSFEGERKQQNDTLGGLFSGLILAMFAIYSFGSDDGTSELLHQWGSMECSDFDSM